MTRNEAVRIILGRCGNRISNAFLRAATISEMALAQETVLEQADFKPWFLLSERLRANTGVGEARMPVPERFLEEHEEGMLWLLDSSSTYVQIPRDDIDTLEARHLNSANGQPVAYGLVQNYMYLFPVPDAEYQLKIRCYRGEPTLTAAYDAENAETLTNKWLTNAADWLIGETGAKIAGSYLKDRETAAEFAEEAKKARQRLYIQYVAREESNRTRSAGDD